MAHTKKTPQKSDDNDIYQLIENQVNGGQQQRASPTHHPNSLPGVMDLAMCLTKVCI